MGHVFFFELTPVETNGSGSDRSEDLGVRLLSKRIVQSGDTGSGQCQKARLLWYDR